MHGFVRTQHPAVDGFAVLGERLDAGVAIIGDDGRVTYANERVAQVCGLTGQSLVRYGLPPEK